MFLEVWMPRTEPATDEVRRSRLARVDAVAQRIHAETGGRRFEEGAPLIREDRAA